jgi:hypothetical protein
MATAFRKLLTSDLIAELCFANEVGGLVRMRAWARSQRIARTARGWEAVSLGVLDRTCAGDAELLVVALADALAGSRGLAPELALERVLDAAYDTHGEVLLEELAALDLGQQKETRNHA